MSPREQIEAIEHRVLEDKILCDFLDHCLSRSRESTEHTEALKRFDVSATDLWLLGLLMLWRVAKIGVDHLRQVSEIEATRKILSDVKMLRDLGYSKAAAVSVIERLLKDIRDRSQDDPVIRAIEGIVKDHSKE